MPPHAHHPKCSNQTPEDQIAALCKVYDLFVKTMGERDRLRIQLHERVTFWLGKYTLVKAENNALRRKLYRQERRPGKKGLDNV
jgi:hypothetical protein